MSTVAAVSALTISTLSALSWAAGRPGNATNAATVAKRLAKVEIFRIMSGLWEAWRLRLFKKPNLHAWRFMLPNWGPRSIQKNRFHRQIAKKLAKVRSPRQNALLFAR